MSAGMIAFAAYVLVALVAARATGRRLAKVAVREWPTLYRDGFRAEGVDWFLVLFIGALWPIGVPVFWLLTSGLPERRTPQATPAERFVFGGDR